MQDPRASTYVRIGFVYGLALTVCGAGLLAGGHGTALPLVVFSSPLGLLVGPFGGMVGPFLALIGPIPLWTLLTILVVRARPKGQGWKVGLPALAVHYLGILLVVHLFPSMVPWDRVIRVWGAVPEALVVSAVLYLIGQVGFWVLSLMPYRRKLPKVEEVWRD